jgi:hypothetical protein
MEQAKRAARFLSRQDTLARPEIWGALPQIIPPDRTA